MLLHGHACRDQHGAHTGLPHGIQTFGVAAAQRARPLARQLVLARGWSTMVLHRAYYRNISKNTATTDFVSGNLKGDKYPIRVLQLHVHVRCRLSNMSLA
jgi:hypothetical protein